MLRQVIYIVVLVAFFLGLMTGRSNAQFTAGTAKQIDQINNNTQVDITINPVNKVVIPYLNTGDLVYNDGGLTGLAAGTEDQILSMSALGFPEWIDFVPSPLTTKGDLYTHDGTDVAREPVGTDGQLLSANSANANGLEWIDPPSSSPTTTQGDIIVRGVTEDERLPIGTADQLLTSNGTTATWQDAPVSTTLTTKGDIQTFDTANAALPVGTDGQFIVADSAEATGLKWSDTLQGTINPVTDWVDAGATIIDATTTAPTKASSLIVDKMYYKIIGDEAIVRIEYRQTNATGATAGSGDYLFGMPAGLKIDTTKVTPYTTVEGAGTWVANNGVGKFSAWSTANNIGGAVVVYDEDFVRFFGDNASAEGVVSSAFNRLNLGNILFTAVFRVPIQGFSSGLDSVVRYNQLTAETTNKFSATISSTGVVTEDAFDWINGDCSVASSVYDCTLNGSIGVTQALNCQITNDVAGIDREVTYDLANSTASLVKYRTSTSGAVASDSAVTITCYKRASDFDKSSITVANISEAVYSPGSGNGKARVCGFKVTSATSCSNVVGDCISSCANAGTGLLDINFNASYWSSTNYNCTSTAVDFSGIGKMVDGTKTDIFQRVEVRNLSDTLVDSDINVNCHGVAP